MTVSIFQKGYALLIEGTTSEVLQGLVTSNNPRIEGYFVDTATDKRYIIASKVY
jgi:hypothetical protein